MKTVSHVLLGLTTVLAACAPGRGQAPQQVPPSTTVFYSEVPNAKPPCAGTSGLHWARDCFPRWGCPDDYCPNPYPRQCWPPYPTFYRCVSAGDCGAKDGCGHANERLTWWFIPTPQALRDALWLRP